MIKIGSEVICPYNKIGVVDGFLSKEDVFVKVEEYDYKIKKQGDDRIRKTVLHVYGIKILKEIKE